VLGLSRSGYYASRRRRERTAERLAQRAKRDAKVVEIFKAKKRRYGSPRLREELEAEGMTMNRKTVAESMRRQGLRARAAKRFQHTTDSGHPLGVAPTCLPRTSAPSDLMRSGLVTSPTCAQHRAGSTWR